MNYISTRGSSKKCSASEAIVKGISDDGGLFVPSSFPILEGRFLEELLDLDYPSRAAKILALFLEDFSPAELEKYCRLAYSRFDGDPCPVVKIEDDLFVLELFGGPTCAFKDMALTLLPHLLAAAKKKLGIDDRTLVLTATSGDTGKAALEGFKDAEGISVLVFYPSEGVSKIQRVQMTSQQGGNVSVVGIKGNFDDAQRAVKSAFADENLRARLKKQGFELSSANSINLGRLIPQVAYYVSAYCDLANSGEIDMGEKINFAVPSGNFGNALACFYAYKMGLPINKIVVATNANNVLAQVFNDGIYNVKRVFYKTMSPSMDILVPSNFERLVFEVVGRDSEAVKELYLKLQTEGSFEIDAEALRAGVFEAGWADEEETKDAIFNYFDIDDYVFDTHTAVAASVYNEYSCETEDDTPTVIAATASPFKFAPSVLSALGIKEKDAFKAINKLQLATALECPYALSSLAHAEERFKDVISADEIEEAVLKFAIAQREEKE